MINKIRVLRVVTNPSVIPWHMNNTLSRHVNDVRFEIYVVGDNLEQFNGMYGDVQFINWSVKRKPSFFNDIISLFSLLILIKNISPHIIHSLMPKSGFLSSVAAFLCRVPIRVHTFTGQMWNLHKNKRLSYLYWVDRLIFKLNTHCFTDSKSQSEYLYECGFKLNDNSIPYFSNGSLSGVDHEKLIVDKLSVENLKGKYSLHDSFVFIYLARKDSEKGAFEALRIFKKFRNETSFRSKFLFVGPDCSNGALTRLLNEQPSLFDEVIQVDMVDNPFDYLALSNVLLLPSFREGFGSIVIDAALLGIPTIGTNIIGLCDAIENNETGILFDISDHDEAVRAMKKLTNDLDYYNQMVANARKRVLNKFCANKIHRELVGFYLDESKHLCNSYKRM